MAWIRILFAAGCALLPAVGWSQRVSIDCDSGWKFHRGDVPGASAPAFDDHAWSSVSLPHVWDLDRDPPQKNYYRGPGWYRKGFQPEAAWKDRRVFVRFEAASLVAQVYLNGQLLGEHRGGFTAFCFELTPGLIWGRANLLAVKVDNARREDVIPLGGDFTVFGGLYRGARFLITAPVSISALDAGSSGIFLHPKSVTADSAEVEVAAEITNATSGPASIEVVESVRDRSGAVVAESRQAHRLRAGQTSNARGLLAIRRPHLWDGVADPYLHRVRVEVFSEGKAIDSVEEDIGLRDCRLDPARGFLLNGHALQIRGVAVHQDWGGVGWAVSPAQEETDIELIRSMGATGVRLAHYPHSEHFYSLCDRAGLLVWAELPLVNDVRATPGFRENVRRQLLEMIRQNLNHPSIAIWSLFNEIGPSNRDDPVPIVADLQALAKTEDPSRPSTGALSIDGIEKLHALGALGAIPALNVYPGWYLGVPSDMGPILDRWNAAYGHRGIIVSEYGAGASVRQHQETFAERPGRAPKDWHPEEWQAIVHEQTYSAIRARPEVAASFVWNMFDFASAGRREGDEPGINDKGLVTRDRRIRKDAYFFYQACWTTAPMVYIAGRRDTPRATEPTTIKIYSNCPEVVLTLNGTHFRPSPGPDAHVFLWANLRLRVGENRIEADGRTNSVPAHDACVIVGSPPSSSSSSSASAASPSHAPGGLSSSDDAFLDDLCRRCFRYFWEQSDPGTGIVRGRARADGQPYAPQRRDVGSTGDTGFGLTALCIGAERGWVPREDARQRVHATLRAYAEGPVRNEHGWFYHWINVKTGERTGATYDIAQFGPRKSSAKDGEETADSKRPRSEVSVSDSTWLIAGALTARQYFSEDADIVRWAGEIYDRVDYLWMCGPAGPRLLHMSWMPESGFSDSRYQRYDQLPCMYLLGIAAPDRSKALPAASWYAWERNPNSYGGFSYVGTSNLWTYQYPLAWFDLRGLRETEGSRLDYFKNSQVATRAHRAFCVDLARQFPGAYSDTIWGITSSLSRTGYRAWGGPPAHGRIDGTVVPCAPAGSLMLAPDICLPALRAMKERFGDRIYGRYGFADAFQPVSGWAAEDIIALDTGITLLSAENLRSGNVWRWFMANPEAQRALKLAKLAPENL